MNKNRQQRQKLNNPLPHKFDLESLQSERRSLLLRLSQLDAILKSTNRSNRGRVYNRTIHGLLMNAHNQIRYAATGRKKNRNGVTSAPQPFTPQEEFLQWAKCDTGFLVLFREWASSGYDKRYTPTIFRHDPTGGYIVDNIDFTTKAMQATITGLTTRKRRFISENDNRKATLVALKTIKRSQ